MNGTKGNAVANLSRDGGMFRDLRGKFWQATISVGKRDVCVIEFINTVGDGFRQRSSSKLLINRARYDHSGYRAIAFAEFDQSAEDSNRS